MAHFIEFVSEGLGALSVAVCDEDFGSRMRSVFIFADAGIPSWMYPRPMSMVAMARPMPLAPPVMYAVLPDSDMSTRLYGS